MMIMKIASRRAFNSDKSGVEFKHNSRKCPCRKTPEANANDINNVTTAS